MKTSPSPIRLKSDDALLEEYFDNIRHPFFAGCCDRARAIEAELGTERILKARLGRVEDRLREIENSSPTGPQIATVILFLACIFVGGMVLANYIAHPL